MSRLESCPFAKHRGKAWDDVIAADRPYVEWLISGDSDAPDLEEELYDHLVDLLEEAWDQ